MTDTPRPFAEEFREVFEDVMLDFGVTITDWDPDFDSRLVKMIQTLMKDQKEEYAANPRLYFRHLSALLAWMFLAGREHAARGYPSPVGRGDGFDDGRHDDGLGIDDEQIRRFWDD